MTINNTTSVAPAVMAFLELLRIADSVQLEHSPLLSTWEVDKPTGVATNQVISFSWHDDDANLHRVCLTEEGIAQGQWQNNVFCCSDHEGDTVQIHLHKHHTLSPNAKCEAEIFLTELLDNHETLAGIADLQGDTTLVDLMYLYTAINTDGFISVFPDVSKVHEIVLALPSGVRWAKFLDIQEG